MNLNNAEAAASNRLMKMISRWMAGVVLSVMLSGCSGAGLEPVHMEDKPLAQPLPINTRPRILAIGQGFSVGIKKDGTVWSWGSNFRQAYLGRPTANENEALVPAQVPGLKDAMSVVASSSHTLVLLKDGTVWSWGENNHGQLGYPTPKRHSGTPQKIPGLTDVVDIAAQWGVSQALKKDGTVWGFGWGSGGRLGKTAREDHNPVMQVEGLKDIVRIEIGYDVSMAIDKEGRLWTYGEDVQRQGRLLGKNTKEMAAVPGIVKLPRRVVEVSADSDAVFSLLEDGTVWSWGYNNGGQLGTGEKSEKGRPLPERISNLSSIVAVSSLSGGSVVSHHGIVATWGVSAAAPPPESPLSRHDLAIPHRIPFKPKMPIMQLVGGYAIVDANGEVFFWHGNSRGKRGTGHKVADPTAKYWITPEKSLWSYN